VTAGPAHLRWVDELPPPENGRARGRHDHDAIAAALRQKPGQWAMLPDAPGSLAGQIHYGSVIAYRPAGSYEAHIRQGNVYARYRGDNPQRDGH